MIVQRMRWYHVLSIYAVGFLGGFSVRFDPRFACTLLMNERARVIRTKLRVRLPRTQTEPSGL